MSWRKITPLTVRLRRVSFVSRLLLLAGAGAMAVSVLLTWVTIDGPSIALDLPLIGAEVSPRSRTIAGTDTALWPVVVAIAAVVAILGLLGVARRLLLALGLLVVGAGNALLYYVSNAVEIESNDRGRIEQLVADALISSATGPGPPLLIAAGIAIVAGALLLRGPRPRSC